jgi:isopentenyl-diphosphate delta-isomerase
MKLKLEKMEEVKVILVNENDNETGLMGKTEAHEKGVLHRAVSVFVINTDGDWLLQRRAFGKYHSAGLWTNACCSHPLPGESTMDAAKRRLSEEMGMDCELIPLFNFTYREILENGLIEHELDYVFLGISNRVPVINDSEVAEYKYFNFNELKNDIQNNPENYTVWFRKIYEMVNQQIIKLKN